MTDATIDDDPQDELPPFEPDPELVDHAEGNQRERDAYRAHARRSAEAARAGRPS